MNKDIYNLVIVRFDIYSQEINMKKQGKSPGHARSHNGIKKKSLGKNKSGLKKNKLKKGTMKFVNDNKNAKNTKPLVEKLLSQGEVVKGPGSSPKKNKNKQRNKSKKGVAPIVNPDIDNAVYEESSDEEMIKEESTEGLQSPTNSAKKNKNKNKKKKLGLLAAKKENKENGENNEDNEIDQKEENTSPDEQKVKSKHPKKFILFIGNLPYDVKKEQVREHFKSVKDGIKDIRLSTDEKTGKGRGFAFIELPDNTSYQAALKLNKRKMGERVIRVEYTTPGKSQNKSRKKFMNSKTKKLLGQKKHKKGKGFNKKKGKGKK